MAGAVHPRVGGEQIPNLFMIAIPVGSSPRGRGTDLAIGCGPEDRRFIPAWAGNSQARS